MPKVCTALPLGDLKYERINKAQALCTQPQLSKLYAPQFIFNLKSLVLPQNPLKKHVANNAEDTHTHPVQGSLINHNVMRSNFSTHFVQLLCLLPVKPLGLEFLKLLFAKRFI